MILKKREKEKKLINLFSFSLFFTIIVTFKLIFSLCIDIYLISNMCVSVCVSAYINIEIGGGGMERVLLNYGGF